MIAPLPADEAARLEALYRYHVLDTDPEETFDALARLAATICRTPIALLSLVDAERQWIKSQVGITLSATPRQLAFCAHTILQRDPLVVPDTTQDRRFAHHPSVTGAPHIRFYAGAPLLTPDGHALGTLCVADYAPRTLDAEQVEALGALSRQVMALLEARCNRAAASSASLGYTQVREALRDAESRVNDILESITDGFIAVDREWRYTYLNAKAMRQIQQPQEEILGKVLWEVFPQAVGSQYHTECRRAMQEQTPAHFEEYLQAADRWFEYHVYPTRDGIAIYTQDITERKAMEDALRESEERFRSVIRSMKEGIVLIDAEGMVRLCNESAAQILEISADEMIGQPACDLPWRMVLEESSVFSGETPIVLLSLCTGVSLHDVTMGMPTAEGALKWISVNSTPLFRFGENRPYAALATFADITERKQNEHGLKRMMRQMDEYRMTLQRQKLELEVANAKLATLAVTDGLTGLKNQRAFREKLREEFQRATRYHFPLSLVLLDVDRFKEFNDAFGHPAGDTVLQAVAEILQSAARTTDFVARYGGEEFAIILPNTDSDGAAMLGERFRAAIETASWKERLITASVGIASLTLTTPDPALLMGEADAALYASKKSGRNRTTHYANLPAAAELTDYAPSPK